MINVIHFPMHKGNKETLQVSNLSAWLLKIR